MTQQAEPSIFQCKHFTTCSSMDPLMNSQYYFLNELLFEMVDALQCFLKSLCIIVYINDQILAVILILLCSLVSIWTDAAVLLSADLVDWGDG